MTEKLYNSTLAMKLFGVNTFHVSWRKRTLLTWSEPSTPSAAIAFARGVGADQDLSRTANRPKHLK